MFSQLRFGSVTLSSSFLVSQWGDIQRFIHRSLENILPIFSLYASLRTCVHISALSLPACHTSHDFMALIGRSPCFMYQLVHNLRGLLLGGSFKRFAVSICQSQRSHQPQPASPSAPKRRHGAAKLFMLRAFRACCDTSFPRKKCSTMGTTVS